MNRLVLAWEKLRSSLWFTPALMVAAAVALAVGLIQVEIPEGAGRLAARWPRVFGAGAEGSRGLLSAIASSMITVAGVVFSITVVALTLASNQYTPRILRNFMRDRPNQLVIGVLMGVFAYCLVVLRTIRGGEDGVFVPGLAVLGAVLLAFVAIGFLVFFIHHVAESLQATRIVESVADETLEAVDRLFPDPAGDEPEQALSGDGRDLSGAAAWVSLPAHRSGYLQAFDTAALLELAREEGVVVRMEKQIGEFVIQGCPLASISNRPLHERLVQRLNAACSLGRYRTVEQDAGYGIRQIVDIALKALSPGINDTTTAINCVDYLATILARLVDRSIAAPLHREDGHLLLITRDPTFAGLVAVAFDQIRQNAAGNTAVLGRQLEVLATLRTLAPNGERVEVLRGHERLIVETVDRTVPSAHDRARLRERAGVSGLSGTAG